MICGAEGLSWFELSAELEPTVRWQESTEFQAFMRLSLVTRGARILVADEDPLLQRALRRAAARRHWQALTVSTGKAALAVAVATAPDAIVLRLALPDACALDVLARLKADPRTSSTPVFLWESCELEPRASLTLGAEAWIAKLDTDLLLSKLMRALFRRRNASASGLVGSGSSVRGAPRPNSG